MKNSSVFDYEKLLDTYYNEEKLIQEILLQFINTVQPIVNELATEDIKIERIKFIAHYIKGSAFNLMCTKLGEVAERLQIACDNNDLTNIETNKDSVIALFSTTTEAIQSKLSS